MKKQYDFSKGLRGRFAEKTCVVVELSNVDSACEYLKLNRVEFIFERSTTEEGKEGMKFIFAKYFEKGFIEALYRPMPKVGECQRGV